jgi:AraC-like DNA-binding protein
MNPVAPDARPEPSLLQRMLELLNAAGPLRASFDDITGICLDYPLLALPLDLGIHSCEACVHAKQERDGRKPGSRRISCSVNKRTVNRLVIRRRAGFEGLCRLGAFDLVEPLVVKGSVLGVFYYGSVVVRETEAEAERRIRARSARRGLDPTATLAQWRLRPRIAAAEVPAHRARLRAVVESVRLWCEAWAVPVEHYPPMPENVFWERHHHLPPLVRLALKYVTRRYEHPCRVQDVAAHAHCHPNYLSGEFKKHTGQTLSTYVEWVRIDRAKALLRNGRLDVGEVCLRCGFVDTSHFIRVFKRHVGLTPKAFQQRLPEK